MAASGKERQRAAISASAGRKMPPPAAYCRSLPVGGGEFKSPLRHEQVFDRVQSGSSPLLPLVLESHRLPSAECLAHRHLADLIALMRTLAQRALVAVEEVSSCPLLPWMESTAP